MSKKHKAKKTDTLMGVITPVEWESDEVSAVALSATDDEEYRIENGEKFIDLVHSYIEATGDISRNKKSFKSIRIKRFKILESF